MRRLFGALAVGLGAVAVAQAHALFVLPAADPGQTTVVFNHELEPDPMVKPETWQKMAGLKLVAVGADGKPAEVKWTKEADHLKVAAPAGTRVVYGQVDYGVYAKGDNPPKFVRYYPKAVFPGGDPAAAVGGDQALEVTADRQAGKTRFRVLFRGKPVAAAKVSVIAPEKKDEVELTTDADGYTSGVEGVGRFGVTARHEEKASGEAGGKKYEAVSHVATLVVDVK